MGCLPNHKGDRRRQYHYKGVGIMSKDKKINVTKPHHAKVDVELLARKVAKRFGADENIGRGKGSTYILGVIDKLIKDVVDKERKEKSLRREISSLDDELMTLSSRVKSLEKDLFERDRRIDELITKETIIKPYDEVLCNSSNNSTTINSDMRYDNLVLEIEENNKKIDDKISSVASSMSDNSNKAGTHALESINLEALSLKTDKIDEGDIERNKLLSCYHKGYSKACASFLNILKGTKLNTQD
jgi:hypothetical protein